MPRPPGRLRRPLQLRQAAIVASVFVFARVVYYVVFAGANGTGIRLLSLPLVDLPAPFSGVSLLGPVTSGGLVAALVSALPFAAAIVGFGALSAVFDVRAWLAAAARRGPARSLARACAIAWQLMPALGAAVRRCARAARLRGERPGPTTLVPLLEGAIERAIALAASLELRGFAATQRLDGDCSQPARMTDVVLSRPSWSLAVRSLRLAPGTLTVLSGPTGAGKSTVLDALSGLFQHVDGGRQSGAIEVGGVDRLAAPPRETSGFVAAVAQRVRLAFVGETVAEEIGYALALRGVAPVIVADRVRETAERVGVSHLVGRAITALSAGEAELVALAAAIVERPTLLLVDEPLAELDAQARPRMVSTLAALAHEAGMCVVVAEHRASWFGDVADAWLTITAGELRDGAAAPSRSPAPVVSSRTWPQHDRQAVVGRAVGVTVRHAETIVVDSASLELRAGELVALVGPNGAGKSSLLAALALPSEAGRVFVLDRDVRAMKRRVRHAAVALVPEELEDLFVTDSVRAECRRADRYPTARRASRDTGGSTGPSTGRGVRRASASFDIFAALAGATDADAPALADVHPRDLSGGQRVCLAIALQLAADPAVLLIDEPVRGLDAAAQQQLAVALRRAAARGTAVLFATHEHEFAAALADRAIRLSDGILDSGAARTDDCPATRVDGTAPGARA